MRFRLSLIDMLKAILWICFICLFPAVRAQHVLFGERNLEDPRMALYFDRQGTVYPDFTIPDSSLRSCGGNLSDWYSRHPAELEKICAMYRCDLKGYSAGNLHVLQDSVVRRAYRRINALKGQSVTFLIHGYRKRFTDADNALSSVREFAFLRNRLDSLKLRNDLYVEVYWDGTYDCCFSTHKKKNDSLFRMFESAQQHASDVGLSLRRILDGVEAPQINIVAHSLGCKVAAASLFNLDNSKIETPGNARINLCLIAPAIGGVSVFSRYFERNTGYDFKAKDNYRVYVLYNEKDFVLRKKDNKTGLFGPGTIRYGETTLGCNYRGELYKVESCFKDRYPNSTFRVQDMTSLGKNHSLRSYTLADHLAEMVRFLNEPLK